MADGRRWSTTNSRVSIAIALGLAALFVTAIGAGMSSAPVAWSGLTIGVMAIAFIVLSGIRAGAAGFTRGTAHVVTATIPPPSSASRGRCEMHLVIEAAGLSATAVLVRDPEVPVGKWPVTGDTLPILVNIRDPRQVRIRWDRVRTHGQIAADETPRRGPYFDDAAPHGGARPVPELPAEEPNSSLNELLDETRAPEPVAEGAAAEQEHPNGALLHGVGVTLVVAKLARSVEFYRDVLGLAEIDHGANVAVLATGRGRLFLRQVPDVAQTGPRLMHLNLEVTDLTSAYERLRAAGVEFSHRPRAVAHCERIELWAVSFRDPDGHGVALTNWRPTG